MPKTGNVQSRDLAHRWNVEASRANYAGSEYHDNPEFVFARVRELQHKYHRVMLENVELRRKLAEQDGK